VVNAVACGVICLLDRSTQELLQSAALQQSAALHAIAQASNWWGGPGVIWFAALLWLGGRVLGKVSVAELGLRGAEGLAVASAISGITKGLASRARPFVTPGEPWHFEFAHGWTDAHYFSMPSGHTTATFGFVVAASLAATRLAPRSRYLFASASILSAVAVGFARAYTDQHWLTDVIAGAALGTLTGWSLVRLHRRIGPSVFDRVLLGGPRAL
jgi:membrane-associated phospholipid phosphatase